MHLTELDMHTFNRITYMYLTESHKSALKNPLYVFNRITHAGI